MPWRQNDRRKHGGLSDEQLQEITERVTFLLEQDEGGLCDRISKQLERRLFEWFGRKFAQWLLLLAGAAAAGAWVLVQYVKAQVI